MAILFIFSKLPSHAFVLETPNTFGWPVPLHRAFLGSHTVKFRAFKDGIGYAYAKHGMFVMTIELASLSFQIYSHNYGNT